MVDTLYCWPSSIWIGNCATSTTLRNWRGACLGSGVSYAPGVERTRSIHGLMHARVVYFSIHSPALPLPSGNCKEWRVVCMFIVLSRPSISARVVQVRVAWRKRDRQAFHFRNMRHSMHIEHIHRHSNTSPTTASNSVLPISAIPFNPKPSTSIRSSCGRFIRIALPTVVASV